VRNDLVGGYLSAVKFLKQFLLAGFEAACFAVYLLYGLFLILRMNALLSAHWAWGPAENWEQQTLLVIGQCSYICTGGCSSV
jgi:hypothetical protein